MKYLHEISFSDTFSVRHPVLRAGKPLDSCHFDGDELVSTKHFGLFVDNFLIGVVSVFKNNSAIFIASNQYQIRGMAVLADFQKKGYGADLVKHCEDYVLQQKGTLIWFNARENAVTFYEKLNYSKIGNPFNIADIGLHYIMKKEIGENAYE